MTSSKDQLEAAVVPPSGTTAVDIRVFLLTITLAMSGAFWAGISVHLPLEKFVTLHGPPVNTPQVGSIKSTPADLVTEGPHSPSGQHILVDMKGIEADFLDSEERLSDAMVRTVQEAGLNMLSYHCHKLDPAGVSCVGILLESHISFHTWPEEGVITLDLFTCGANPLLPVVPVIERLFGIGEDIYTKWSHDLRGFRSEEERKKNYLDDFSDLSVWVLSPVELYSKTQVYSNLTKYQRVDIWDVAEKEDIPTYEDGIKHNIPDFDPRWESPEWFTPDRMLFLDGIIQSLYSSEEIYHEALVQPAMFAHQGPKRVAVLGGGEGATIREVLKHKSVESVTMIELDEELIAICREYMPKMSNCSDILGRADNCFDDEAVDVVISNAVDYFFENHGPNPTVERVPEPFDVLIVDALDPEEEIDFAMDLYASRDFVTAMLASIATDGILLIQIGTAAEISDPKAEHGPYTIREKLFNLFEEHPDVDTMHVYEEGKSGFLEPHAFLMVCKDISCRTRWSAKADAVDYSIYNRILPTKSGKSPLKHYDGATQTIYQAVPMAWESVYCRREPAPFECAYRAIDFTKEIHEFSFDENDSSFRVQLQKNNQDEIVGSSVFATVDIPKGSFIMPSHLAKSLVVEEEKVESIRGNALKSPGFDQLASFVSANSITPIPGSADVRFVEIGGPTLIRKVEGTGNVKKWVPSHPSGKRPRYSPVYDRHSMSFEVFLVAAEDIPAGAEVTRSA